MTRIFRCGRTDRWPTEHKDIDQLTGTATTGHDWDGIHELNTPLPRWWLWTFYACIVWAIGYWVVYPAWPLLTNSTQGITAWHARSAVVGDLDELKALRGPMMEKLTNTAVTDIVKDAQLLDFARAQGRVAFADNCAPCHGAGGGGGKGYPNLNDDDWLWGGKITEIEQTIRHGARSGDDKGHQGNMPAFGRDGMLKADQISAVADYVAHAVRAAGRERRRSRARQEGVRRQLRALSRAGRQGQPRARRAQSHRPDLALRARTKKPSCRASPTAAAAPCPPGKAG